jgi:hypothetical protein
MVKHIQVEGLRRLSCAPPLQASPHHRLLIAMTQMRLLIFSQHMMRPFPKTKNPCLTSDCLLVSVLFSSGIMFGVHRSSMSPDAVLHRCLYAPIFAYLSSVANSMEVQRRVDLCFIQASRYMYVLVVSRTCAITSTCKLVT